MVVIIPADDNDDSSNYNNTRSSEKDSENKSDSSSDEENNDSFDYNIIINAKQLKNLIEENFVCLHCSRKHRRSKVCVSFCTFRIATEVTCFCLKNKREKPHMQKIGAEVSKQVKTANLYHSPFGKFVSNHLFTLGLLKEGLGYEKSVSLCAFLGLKRPWYEKAYWKMESEVCEDAIKVFNTILRRNLQLEIELSPKIIDNLTKMRS